MDNNNKSLTRLNELLVQAGVIRKTRRSSSINVDFVDEATFYGWRTRSIVFLESVLGEKHSYTTGFKQQCEEETFDDLECGVAILGAIKEDIEHGYLASLETLIRIEVFTDFLEMAVHYLEQGHKDNAAMQAGAVLERSLKEIARTHGVAVADSDDISAVNTKLAQARVYNAAARAEVQAWNTIRNKAAHGEFDEYDGLQVQKMLEGVRSLMAQYS